MRLRKEAVSLERQISEYANQRMELLDEKCRQTIIGSKILDFSMIPIKKTKHMFLLTIHTDASPIRDGNTMCCCNEIKVKVKMQ